MTTGLLALLDDVAALVKAGAASLDDVATQVVKTSGKVSGIVIDDAAVTPKYVVGLDPKRELIIIYKIAKKSLINKLLFLTPAALLLGFYMHWAIAPLLMLGGTYLCFEGYEKIHSIFHKKEIKNDENIEEITPEELEKIRIDSAVRTDFILSAEIIAITYASVAEKDLMTQIMVMISVAIAITIAVYGFVGLVVKADDIGMHFAKGNYKDYIKNMGKAVVKFMPSFLTFLSYVGTIAMLLVGGEIIAHGIPFLHHGLENIKLQLPENAFIKWFINSLLCVIGGLILGAVTAQIVELCKKLKPKAP